MDFVKNLYVNYYYEYANISFILGYHSLSKTQRGLKALIKESQDRLKAYQQMFYLLQTDPNYVARKSSNIIIFLYIMIWMNLYNWGHKSRNKGDRKIKLMGNEYKTRTAYKTAYKNVNKGVIRSLFPKNKSHATSP